MIKLLWELEMLSWLSKKNFHPCVSEKRKTSVNLKRFSFSWQFFCYFFLFFSAIFLINFGVFSLKSSLVGPFLPPEVKTSPVFQTRSLRLRLTIGLNEKEWKKISSLFSQLAFYEKNIVKNINFAPLFSEKDTEFNNLSPEKKALLIRLWNLPQLNTQLTTILNSAIKQGETTWKKLLRHFSDLKEQKITQFFQVSLKEVVQEAPTNQYANLKPASKKELLLLNKIGNWEQKLRNLLDLKILQNLTEKFPAEKKNDAIFKNDQNTYWIIGGAIAVPIILVGYFFFLKKILNRWRNNQKK